MLVNGSSVLLYVRLMKVLHDEQYSNIRENVEIVRDRIAQACERSGRAPESVSMMVVTKTRSPFEIAAALSAGVRYVGESRMQELVAKWTPREQRREPALLPSPDSNADSGEGDRGERSELSPMYQELPLREDIRLALIGHLQSNKAKSAALLADSVASIDKVSTAHALSRRLQDRRDVLIQINTSGEPSKYGTADSDESVYPLVEAVLGDSNLRLRGLMTIAPFVDDTRAIRTCFSRLRDWFRTIETRYTPEAWNILSMGMSGDLEVGIEEGSTEVRPGTAIFGPRPQ